MSNPLYESHDAEYSLGVLSPDDIASLASDLATWMQGPRIEGTALRLELGGIAAHGELHRSIASRLTIATHIRTGRSTMTIDTELLYVQGGQLKAALNPGPDPYDHGVDGSSLVRLAEFETDQGNTTLRLYPLHQIGVDPTGLQEIGEKYKN